MSNAIIKQSVVSLTDSIARAEPAEMTPADQLAWLHQMGQLVEGWEFVSDFSIMTQAKILYHVHNMWDDIENGVAGTWGYDFYGWASQFTKRRAGIQSQQAIHNKITVYRDFVAEPAFLMPKTVTIPARDSHGKRIEASSDKPTTVEVAFDPMCSDFGKLLRVRGAARRGEATPEVWGAVMDGHVTARELGNLLDKDDSGDTPPRLYADESSVLCIMEDTCVPLFSITREFSDHPLWSRGIELAAKRLGVNILTTEPKPVTMPLYVHDGKSLIITKDGVSIRLHAHEIGMIPTEE